MKHMFGGLPPSYRYLWTGILVNRLGSFVIIVLAVYLATAQNLTGAQASLVVGAYGAGGFLGSLIGGWLADRWGRRPTLVTTYVGTAAFTLALAGANGFTAILAVAVALGAFGEAARPVLFAMVADVVQESDRLRAYNLNFWAFNLGFSGAAIIAGAFAHAGQYQVMFAIDAIVALLTAALLFVKVGETRPVTPDTAVAGATRANGMRTVLSDHVFGVFILMFFLVAVVYMQSVATLPLAMTMDGLSPSTYGAVIALNGVLIVIGQPFVPRLVRGLNRTAVMAVASIVVGIGFGLTAFADTALAYAVTVLVWTVGEMLISPASAALSAQLAPAHLRGRYQGLFASCIPVAAFAGPVIGGLVQQEIGNSQLWLGCVALGAVAAIGQLATGRRRERRIADAARETQDLAMAAAPGS